MIQQSAAESGRVPKASASSLPKSMSDDEAAPRSMFDLWSTFSSLRSIKAIVPNEASSILLRLQLLRRQLAGTLRRRNIQPESKAFLTTVLATLGMTANIVRSNESDDPMLDGLLLQQIMALPPASDFAVNYLNLLRGYDIGEPIHALSAQYEGARNYRRGMSWLALFCVMLCISCGAVGVWYTLRSASESTAEITRAEDTLGTSLQELSAADASLRDAITAIVGHEARYLVLRTTLQGLVASTPAGNAQDTLRKALEDDGPSAELALRNHANDLQKATNHEGAVRKDIDSALKVVAKQTVGWTYTALAFVGLGAVALLAWLSATFMRLHREHQHGALRACEQLARLELAKAQFSVGDIDQSLALLETPPIPEDYAREAT